MFNDDGIFMTCAKCMIIDPNEEIFLNTDALRHLGAILLISIIDHNSVILCHFWMVFDMHRIDVMGKL